MKKRKKLIISMVIFVLIVAVFCLPAPVSAAGTETWLRFNSSGDGTKPSVYGDNVVWVDTRDANWDIYLYNLVSGAEKQITTDPGDQVNPKIFQNLIIWEDYRDPFPGIYLYDITTGTETRISDGTSWQHDPAIWGNRIVWSDDRSGLSNIYINGTSPGLETPLSSQPADQGFPAIYGDLVVWQDGRNGAYYNIYMYNITSSQEIQVTSDSNGQIFPAIYGNRVVWIDSRTPFWEIFINGTAPDLEYSLTPGVSSNARYPAVNGNKVIWQQYNLTTNYWDFFMNDTSVSGSKIPVLLNALTSSPDAIPSIFADPTYGDRIVWQDDRSGTNSVSLYTSNPGAPADCPVAGFFSDFAGGGAPVTVQFTDTTPPLVTHRYWEYGDGASVMDPSPAVHTYTVNNPYTVTHIVSNPWCRNATVMPDFIIVGAPVAHFTASPISEIVPATIDFTDTSNGIPDTWSWDFGDGGSSTEQNPTYVYTVPGTYNVSLTASNIYGSNTSTRTGYIHALVGANHIANTTIDGLSLDNCGAGLQTITVDTSVLTGASLTPNTSVLELHPPADRGFDTVIVYALDGTGFTVSGPIISGHVTGIYLLSNEIVPTGFSSVTGPVSFSYSANLPSYPCNATLKTQVWEGTTPDDHTLFERIAIGSSFASVLGIPYTARITKTNFPAAGTAKLRMSANATWVTVNGGHNQIYIERIADNRQVGEVLRTSFVSHNPAQNLDYFEADSPRGLSTFGLSALSGSGNPLQLITLTVTRHVEPPSGEERSSGSDSDSTPAGGKGGGKVIVPVNTTAPTATPRPAITVDPGTSAKVYTNANGVVTQAFLLRSTDGRATVSIREGVVAKDASGKPLPEITIRAIPSESLPDVPAGSAFTFAGMAYEIGPDGATFSPPITLSFTLTQARWGVDYSVKSFDHATGTWQDLPMTFDATTGIVTVQVSHFCCFALFSEPREAAVTPAPPRSTPAPAAPQVKVQPPTTAASVFMSMLGWIADLVVNNIIPFVAFIFLGIAGYLVVQGRFPGSGQ